MTAGRGMKTIAKWQSDRLRQGEGGWQLGGQQGSKAARQKGSGRGYGISSPNARRKLLRQNVLKQLFS